MSGLESSSAHLFPLPQFCCCGHKGLPADMFSNLKLFFPVESVLGDIGSVCAEVVWFPYLGRTVQRQNPLTHSRSTIKQAESQQNLQLARLRPEWIFGEGQSLFLAFVKSCPPMAGVRLPEVVSLCPGYSVLLWDPRKEKRSVLPWMSPAGSSLGLDV